MAAAKTRTICVVCNKSKITYICEGCSQYFCFEHLSDHRKNLGQLLGQIQNDHDQLRQNLNDQKIDPSKHPLIERINQWEKDSMEKIQQSAQHYRSEWMNYINNFLLEMDSKLTGLAQQIIEIHQENEFSEIDLNHLERKLEKLRRDWDRTLDMPFKRKDIRWKQFGKTIAGGNGQFNCPHGICFDDHNQTIYIADRDNARIVEWMLNENNGRIVAGGNGQGNRLDQLNQPTDVIIDRENENDLIIADQGNRRVVRWSRQSNSQGQIVISDIDCARLVMHEDGSLYVSDWNNNEVKRWKSGETHGIVIAGGNGKGNQLNQLCFPTSIFVDDDHTLYVSDRDNHRVMKWTKDAKEGVVVAGENDQGNLTTQLSFPQGMTVDQFGHIYVADHDNHRIVRWDEGASEGTIMVGGNGPGNEPNQLSYPIGLTIDGQGNLYVADYGNDRIQKFDRDE